MNTETAMEILRAAKLKAEAEKAAAVAEDKRRQDECAEVFAPVLEFWNSVKYLMVRQCNPNSAWQSSVPFQSHVNSVSRTCINFWGCNDNGLTIYSEYDAAEGSADLKMRNHTRGRYIVPDAVYVTAEEAIAEIAQRGVQYDIKIP